MLGCGSSSEKLGFSGSWISTGGEELSLEIGAVQDGEYPVKFTGGDVKLDLSATQESDTKYRAAGETSTMVFNMVSDDLMNFTIIPDEGKAATASFKRK